MEDMRKKEDHLEKEMMEVSVQNKRLADPLQKARDDMNEMQKKLSNYERDKQILLVSFLLSSPPSHFLLGSGQENISRMSPETQSRVWPSGQERGLSFL